MTKFGIEPGNLRGVKSRPDVLAAARGRGRDYGDGRSYGAGEQIGDGEPEGGEGEDMEREIFDEDIVRSVREDFERRRLNRRQFEAQWRLNANFALGNQYCSISPTGEITDEEKDYFWQEREVFNHIASIVETRLAKLRRVRPAMSVRPAGGDDDDIKTARAASKILTSATAAIELDKLLSDGAMWSELTGSAFYKIVWDDDKGAEIGSVNSRPVYEGDVGVEVCPPYEIYPDELTRQDIDDCRSLIHARALATADIEAVYGVKVPAERGIETAAPSSSFVSGGLYMTGAAASVTASPVGCDSALVIERYERPSPDKPEGELAVVCSDKLLYLGPLPYANGANGSRCFPFVKQDCQRRAGCFFGQSMVERAIPIQRAYNAVKNRKHEFLNRISMGVLTVEDGSVDMESLVEEGLGPGKIIVYRQGSAAPRLMDGGTVPAEFSLEEDRLNDEFIAVSGVSEIMRSSSLPRTATSGVALQLLIEQDDTRLSVTAESVRQAARNIGKQVLRLYKQFARHPRLARFVGDGGDVELLSFTASDIGCDDIVFDTENELNSTLAMRQNTIFELLKNGLLVDADGRMSEDTRYKVLDTLGFGGWESAHDNRAVHVRRADRENICAASEPPEVSGLDNHALHIERHTQYALDEGNFNGRRGAAHRRRLTEHIRQHKKFQREEETENGAQGSSRGESSDAG